MEEIKAESAAMPAASMKNSNGHPALPTTAALRYRLPTRQPASHEPSPSPRRPTSSPLARRRSSLLSYSSLEDIRQAFTDDFVDPRINNTKKQADENEVTHWHSTPLAFAILPALGGLFFKEGKAFTSDILLLGLAAIFLNWSIRLPWDWYYSAQTLRRDIEPDNGPELEDLVDEVAIETASSVGDSPILSPRDRKSSEPREFEQTHGQSQARREEAAEHLRRQETLALMATFVFPVLAAYLLHVIRSQLSGTSTGLVSDYNLSIFLLAAEIRPCRQIVRLVSSRTLHLQRTVAGADDPFSSHIGGGSTIDSLTQRITELEAKLSDHTIVPSAVTTAQKADVNELSTELRKRYEPRLEGLERAVRRYEKRSTTLAITVEQRLQSLEHRIQEALSLAAVAAQHSQHRGTMSKLLEIISTAIVWPVSTIWNICMSPVLLFDELYARAKALLLGTASVRSNKRKNAKHDNFRDERTREKAPVRKATTK